MHKILDKVFAAQGRAYCCSCRAAAAPGQIMDVPKAKIHEWSVGVGIMFMPGSRICKSHIDPHSNLPTLGVIECETKRRVKNKKKTSSVIF